MQAEVDTSHQDRSQGPRQPSLGRANDDSLADIDTNYDSSVAEDMYNNDDEDFSSSCSIATYDSAECALLAYSRTNKIDKLKGLLEAKHKKEISLNLNYKGHQKQNYSWSALHLACYFGHERIVEALLASKDFRDELDINIRNSSGDTPLHKATLTNRVDIVQLLLSNGANVFVKNCDDVLAKDLTSDKHIREMLEASEQADRNLLKQNMFKAVDNGDLKKLQEYFREFDALRDIPEQAIAASECSSERVLEDEGQADTQEANDSTNGRNRLPSLSQNGGGVAFSTAELVNQMTDERGNTLLHLATMRGFKAICVYLLELGFDPFKKNNLGQTCIELASYQLRQLFMSVKPAGAQLKKLSKGQVTRFEGPLLRKVRILGWKQIYVVLENGVILLFNNRRDSMNRSRKGYKYLESAVCEADPSNVGMFTVKFSDNSRATFLVSANHSNYYTTFKLSTNEPMRPASGNQIELVRQKWIDSIRDHIVYSTEFIRKGLKIDDDDDDVESMSYDGSSLANLNHLLPLDTIKSFIQEARAHYSILERHAESLCNLAQSISFANQQALTNSLELSMNLHQQQQQQQQQRLQASGRWNQQTAPPPLSEQDSQSVVIEPSASNTNHNGSTAPTSTSGKLLNFIRPNRQAAARQSLVDEDDLMVIQVGQTRAQNSSNLASGVTTSGSSSFNQACKSRNNSIAANEFIQDSWPCLLFHLRLLMESSENTKTSMGQALALMEHQEQLRQSRIQDQEERCRVLEESLQTLARDHHELEKSLSMSQIYQSACRSVSMSTDLNEYHDAFEDFDDEKTMTPNSLPSDEELDKRIEEVMNDEERRLNGVTNKLLTYRLDNQHAQDDNQEYSDDNDNDDLESNCSALTIETATDQYVSVADSSQQLPIMETPSKNISSNNSRTKLPAPMIPRDQVSIWSILKNCIGKELSKITMPVVFNEPLTMLQRACEGLQHCHYLVLADKSDDPIERMEFVCAFIISALSGNSLRIVKPFNPLLYETYELNHELEDGTQVKGFSQQVSHHPPITAAYAESDNFTYDGVINPKIKFWGRSVEVSHDGSCRIHLKRHNETYSFKAVACSIHNIIVGKLWFEHNGPLDIRCVETNLQANLVFKQAGWFSNDLHRFDGFITSGLESKSSKKLRFVYGKWSDYMKSVDYVDYENYMRDNQQKLFKIPDSPDQGASSNGISSDMKKLDLSGSPNSVNNNSIPNASASGQSVAHQTAANISKTGDKKSGFAKSESASSLDIPNSRTIWRLDTQFLSEYYNFSLFTMKLNELTPEIEQSLPKTDSRFRPDVRKLEEGDLDGAASEKQRLEEKQRSARSKDKRFKEPCPDLLWFELKNVPNIKEKLYVYKGGYWENKCNSEKFPDLF